MFTLLKKAVYIGLGVSQEAKETLDKLSEKGKQNKSESVERVISFLESGEKMETESRQKIEDICKRVAESVKIPSRSDIDRLKKGLADLAGVVQGMRETK
jgi:polyhydroxyalkanoate synthesis regulator phasin